ncbi:MAG: hypothetical protein AB3N13_02835 [Arenibacterium sp.]
MSRFDLTTVTGLSGFLAMQSSALIALKPLAEDARCNELVLSLIGLAECDLEVLDTQPVHMTPEWSKPPDMMAIDYVILGSRIGTQVLRKRWARSDAPLVKAASAYFSAPSFIALWHQFCRVAEQSPAQGQNADQVVKDAKHLFEFYASCANAALSETETVNA